MNFQELMREFGTQRAVADALKLKHRQTVNNWFLRDRIPYKRQIAIEKMTRGRLKADEYRGNGNGRR